MARNLAPAAKIARREGAHIHPKAIKALTRRNYAPGQHGQSRRPKPSDYALQLREKQKAKYTYGVLEKQFRKTFEEAARRKGVTGENLIKLLEARLDNTVFRMGIAPSRRAARQLVGHRHITVNGKVVNISSYTCRPGDVVGVREKSKALEIVTGQLTGHVNKHSWIEFDKASMSGKILNLPTREQIAENIKEQLIVELYSK